MIWRIIKKSYDVAWADLCLIKRSIISVLVSSLMAPLLYLLAFGYGLGSGLNVEGVSYIAFVIPGVISMTTLSACFTFASSKILIQKVYYCSIDELLLCPIPVSSIVIGKSFMGVIRGLISCSILLMMATFMTSDFHISFWLILVIILSCFTFSFLGVSAGLIAKGHPDLTMFTSLVILPMTFLCGTIFSLNSIPEIVRLALNALPLTYSSAIIRAAALDWPIPYVSLAVMILFCMIFFMIPYYLIKTRRL